MKTYILIHLYLFIIFIISSQAIRVMKNKPESTPGGETGIVSLEADKPS